MKKKIFFAYSLEVKFMNELKKRIELIDEIAKLHNYETYIYLRNVQNWNAYTGSTRTILNACFQEIKDCDLVIADFTAFENKMRTGLSIELGYAKAFNKYIVSLVKDEERPRLLNDLVNHEIFYYDYDELKEKIYIFFESIKFDK